LHAAVERLFEAADAAGVMEICELVLTHFGVQGHLRWRRRDEQVAHLAGQLDLAEDPQGSRTLILEWADLPLADVSRDQLEWLGRLADIRLRLLAESCRL
jgi:hypothetical protein